MKGLVLLVAAMVTIGAAVPASAETKSWRYVVTPVASPDTYAVPRTGLSVAPMGMVAVEPEGTELTVTIADDVNPGGRFAFKICQPNDPGPTDWVCGHGHDDVSTGDICYEGPTTLRGLVPGNTVEIALWFAPSPCPDAAVTGTLTVVG